MAALDAAFHGHSRIDCWSYAGQLQHEGWIAADDAQRLRVLGWFGALIGNTDMRLGNAGPVLTDARPLLPAPAYDMLPMALRPVSSGEVVERQYVVTLPSPEFREDWRMAAAMAHVFWRRIASEPTISETFRAMAGGAHAVLRKAIERHA